MTQFNDTDYVVVTGKKLKTTGEKGTIVELYISPTSEAEMAQVRLDSGKTIQIRVANLTHADKIPSPETLAAIKEANEIEDAATLKDVEGMVNYAIECLNEHVDETNILHLATMQRIDELEGKIRVYNPFHDELEYLIETSHGYFNVTVAADEFYVDIGELLGEDEEFISAEPIAENENQFIMVRHVESGEIVRYWFDIDSYEWPSELYDRLQDMGYDPYALMEND